MWELCQSPPLSPPPLPESCGHIDFAYRRSGSQSITVLIFRRIALNRARVDCQICLLQLGLQERTLLWVLRCPTPVQALFTKTEQAMVANIDGLA